MPSSPIAASTGTGQSNAMAGMGSEDFFKLLVTQLTNQDPLEPTGNQELLEQISSIRDIELSTTLTKSLQTLTGQQRFTSASSLIGQYVTGIPSEGGGPEQGTVVGVRFEGDGRPILMLSSGAEMPLDQVSTIASPMRAAQALVGQLVVGVDQRNPAEPNLVEGLVTAVRANENGEILLELDSGDDLRFEDFVSVTGASP